MKRTSGVRPAHFHAIGALSFLLCLFLAVPILRGQTIPNPSFELDHYENGVGYASQNGGVITGWTISNTSRIGLNIGGTNDINALVDNGMIPDGTNVAFIQSAGTSNFLSTTISGLLPGAAYQVTFRANRRSDYGVPNANWSLNNGPLVPFTCDPPVGGHNPYYTNSATFTATSNTAPLVLENYDASIEDSTVLIDDFSIKILPQTLIQYQVSATDAGTVASGLIPNLGVLGEGTDGGSGVTLTNDIPTDGVLPSYGDSSIVCNGSGGVLAPGTEQLNRTNIANAGGFTYETWFKYNGSGNVNAMIDYAGTEKLIRASSAAGPQMETDNLIFNLIGAAAPGQWHYAAVVFTPTSALSSNDSVTGTYTFYLDTNTPATTVSNITINNFGDTLNSTIGVGMHPSGYSSDYFNGLLYEPRVALGALPGPGLLFQSPMVVTNLAGDYSPGTLLGIVGNAPNGAIVHFDPSLDGQTIILSYPLELGEGCIIDASSLPHGIRIESGFSGSIISVEAVTAVLNSLTVANGNINGSDSGGGAGLQCNFGSTVTVNHCTFTNNQANASSDCGGGIEAYASTLTLNNCTFAGNQANGSTNCAGGIYSVETTLTLNNCTFTGNQALNPANHLGGGGINAYTKTVTINNCTFAGNESGGGGAIYSESDTLNVTNSILSSNGPPTAADVYLEGGTANLSACLVRSNGVSVAGGTTNLTSCVFASDPLLAPLGNYGGPTETMPPLPGSPAVDAGTPTSLTTDQRGYPRPIGLGPDIGAVEGIYNAAGVGKLGRTVQIANGSVKFAFTNYTDQQFLVLAATNLSLPLSNWVELGLAVESPVGSGKFSFTESPTNAPQRYYRVEMP